ncbi:SpoIIIAH-like family protein [Halalkalibacillus halophilus]|uniref:SpoIIIAH-like family protein n=1 Tax=Halalkalibacillus halophilus TaxID=392827 RepID=UPI0004133765|nr:SpoIIIAH-like family protein [Halalkalibacillus halophilus]
MVLKKQTVWLITMLSLLIVLSVYYILSPGGDQVALIPDDEEEREEQEDREDSEEPEDSSVVGEVEYSNLSNDELFTAIRMDKEDHRSEVKEQLSAIVASSNASTEEKNEAIEEMTALQTVAQKETILERMIQQDKEYRDVLVRQEEDFINITVIANELSSTDANHLMQLARDEFGPMEVRVKLQSEE